jgi:hypothetical protein
MTMTSHPELPPIPESVGRVVIDFDGVLAENVWPSNRIGKPIGKGIAILLFYQAQGREIIVYTARPESHKERILGWLRMTGLQDAVYDVVCGKPTADLYVDDRAWNPFEGGTVSTESERAARDAGSTPAPSTDLRVHLSHCDGKECRCPEVRDYPAQEDEHWIWRQLGAVNG